MSSTIAVPVAAKRRRGWAPANAVIGGGLLVALIALALMGLVWSPFDPLKIDLIARFQAPSAAHWLGTDEFGRDVFSRLLIGARTSLWVSLLTVTVAVLAGTVIGMLAGYLRGWTDRVLMMFNDALLAFPGILMALGIMAIIGASKYGIVLALGIAYTPSVVRVVRGTVLSLRELEYIEASRVIGNSELYTMLRHIAPNCLAPLCVLATSMFGWALLSESALSFLGLGVPPPAATWGNMLASSRPYIASAPWLGVFPGLFICLTLLAINLFGDALRDRLDPRMRK
ncbi:ABC transporter permease [Pseudomonas sp. WS 5532]|jgi:peptide/nickel transport system permease protein|uniref:ABC transporter permease n=1 Tax=Pseudomonas TaxID=286 RepID=UPI000C15C45A|nr:MULTISPECIES: ABC transporter permease [Pseudomonas]MCF5144291.1 ABC transporter permease subunit [Pseudomonas sp. PA-6-3C]MCF5150887.1 ABC transporter permease subunit [Pseudomonas sp. PA-6-3F]MCF5161447.1 ABC transporter permease subunit [Pseudomonas sp. PA-6-2E]MCF5177848.1 ABC transporter permease subunit [Pseudomonas sp. PA-6-1D]MCF5194088.1 ABC transporter permease subunit [Pseudomonas sp. PA-6-1H]